LREREQAETLNANRVFLNEAPATIRRRAETNGEVNRSTGEKDLAGKGHTKGAAGGGPVKEGGVAFSGFRVGRLHSKRGAENPGSRPGEFQAYGHLKNHGVVRQHGRVELAELKKEASTLRRKDPCRPAPLGPDPALGVEAPAGNRCNLHGGPAPEKKE